MDQESRLITAIDVGTTKVCTLVARCSSTTRFEVLAHSTVQSEGIRKGTVSDVESLLRAVTASVGEVQREMGFELESAYVGITGAHVTFENRRDKLDWIAQGSVITANDMERLRNTVSVLSTDTDRKVIHAIPMAYSLDGNQGIRNPIGMHAQKLEVETHLVTGTAQVIDNFVQAIEGAGVHVSGLVLEPLASGQAVLSAEERESGTVLVDIGGGTTDLVVFKRGRICYTAIIPVGGFQFTNDLAMTYSIPYSIAEDVKLKYATTEPFAVAHDQNVTLPTVSGKFERRVLRRDICQLIRERAQELVDLIDLKLKEARLGDPRNVRLVLTGGASNLPGLADMISHNVTRKVRIGVPDGHAGLPERCRDPAYATLVGILLWAMGQPEPASGESGGGLENGRASLLSRLIEQVRKFIPIAPFLPKREGI